MEREILKALKKESYTSGEELARSLGITRTAIWKHIKNLRQKGYTIHSSPKLGYRLDKAPDLLTPAEIQMDLATCRFGRSVHYFNRVTSTQDEARHLAESGVEEGALVVAEAQTAGRGRRGRQWLSPEKTGIYLSLILKPELEPFNIAQIPIVAGIAVCEGISEITNLKPRIKWPNDVLLQGKKVAGILVEMSAEPERIHYLILGIGINVNTPSATFTGDLQQPAISLSEVAGGSVNRRRLLQALLAHFEVLYEEFKAAGFVAFRERLRRWDQTVESWVKITDSSGSYSAYALDIDDNGALVVRDRQGTVKRILAGDATLEGDSRFEASERP
jgi:BirA family biotin operon repressor/biotin-[acetyl-CoA-carboxylase] ligase